MIKRPIHVLMHFFIPVLMILVMVSSGFAGPHERELLAAARAADRRGDLDEALSLFSRAIGSDGLDKDELATAINDRGILYRLKGQHDLAIADYTWAIKLKADFAEAYSNRGLAYAKSERYDPAIIDFTRSIELQPGNAMTYLKRGNAYFDKRDLDQAIADWSRAIAIKPDLMRAYYNRCDAYEKKGQKSSAVEDCRKVLELEPDFQPARDALEWLTGAQTGERPCFCNY
jgi:tetratricopeptide (TPR) repeat protein